MSPVTASRDHRVLLLALTAKDAQITWSLLRTGGIDVETCESFDALLAELRLGAAAVVMAEERLTPRNNSLLAALLREQPAWSDLPVILVTRPGADSAAAGEAVRTLGNVVLLERPVRVTALLSAVRTAVRARERQYQIREHLDARERAAEALREADRRKDEFLATLGHELRNPLAPLRNGIHLLNAIGRDTPKITEVTAVMERQVSHLVRLVDDLLEVSRITRGIIDVKREPLDLVALLRGALDTARPAFDATKQQLTVDLPSVPIFVAGDAVRLAQVFANLLTNAAKYTDAGGHVTVTARENAGRATVSVRDDGIGIPPGQLDAVFEMFTQVDRSNRRAQGGLGIGLTLVRSLVAMHGGTVVARSAGIGKGSEFLVTLPVLENASVALAAADGPPLFPPRRVLVVDDNHDAADTLGALLTALGATVAVTHSGRAALATLDEFEAQAVLLDIGMPGMDGYEVARRIRANERFANTLLVALTGWGQEEDQRQSREAGIDYHLVKPPDLARLRELLADTPAARGIGPSSTNAGARPH